MDIVDDCVIEYRMYIVSMDVLKLNNTFIKRVHVVHCNNYIIVTICQVVNNNDSNYYTVVFQTKGVLFQGPQAWVNKNWTFSIYASVLYLVTIFSLKKWMEDRKPFNLRTLLVMWNTGLALFSLLGVSCLLPELIK